MIWGEKRSTLPPTGNGPADDARSPSEYDTSCPYAACVMVGSSIRGVPPCRSVHTRLPLEQVFSIRYSVKRMQPTKKATITIVSGTITICNKFLDTIIFFKQVKD
jgi:hypothetical protein